MKPPNPLVAFAVAALGVAVFSSMDAVVKGLAVAIEGPRDRGGRSTGAPSRGVTSAGIAGVAMLLLAGCGVRSATTHPSIVVELSRNGTCAAAIAGKSLPALDSPAFDASFQKRVPDKRSGFLVTGNVEEVKSCVGKLSVAVRRLGYDGLIAFISEEPLPGMVIRH